MKNSGNSLSLLSEPPSLLLKLLIEMPAESQQFIFLEYTTRIDCPS